MKFQKHIALSILFLAFSSLSAQTLTKEKWSQLKVYNKLLTKTFQDVEVGNLETLKKESLHLFEKAEAITDASVPEELNSQALLEKLVVLRRETKMVNDFVQNRAPDAKILKAFTKLNSTFQQILGMCQPETETH